MSDGHVKMTMIMATIVGVRELKLHAPRLVDRAARGETIIITRYGRVRARLVPPDADVPPPSVWLAERAAFERLQPTLTKRYRGRWVAIQGGRVVGSDTDHDRLFERMWKRFRGHAMFIGRVGGPPSVVEMPGFEAT